jgi:hypothetical protein
MKGNRPTDRNADLERELLKYKGQTYFSKRLAIDWEYPIARIIRNLFNLFRRTK